MTTDCGGDEQFEELVDWTTVSADPDLEADLGYELHEMDVVETNNGSGQLLLLPWNEEMLREESFMVVHRDAVVDLIDNR